MSKMNRKDINVKKSRLKKAGFLSKSARFIALEIKEQADARRGYVNLILASRLRNEHLSPADKGLVTELVAGTIRRQGSIDWLIKHYSSAPFGKIPRLAKNILRLAIYQIIYDDHIPNYAAVNEGVEQAKTKFHQGMASFVNGILRGIAGDKSRLPWPDERRSAAQYISVTFSHPQWLVKRWLAEIGAVETKMLCAANNERPRPTLRTNTLKMSRDQLLERLVSEGYKASPGRFTKESIILQQSLLPYHLLDEGLFYLQDESSILVGHALDPQPGETVVDLCSGPGGKTSHMAQLMSNRGKIYAVDLHPNRLKLVIDNCRRLGIEICVPVRGDATTDLDLPAADRVLVDAPCSGLGVLARRPDLRWQKRESNIKKLAALQAAVLDRATRYVKPGGVLVYSVCTLTPEETKQLVDSFLERHLDFKLQTLPRFIAAPGLAGDKKYVQTWPHRHHIDGMFIAKMVRR